MAGTELDAIGSDAAADLALAGRVTGAPKPSLPEAIREFEGYFVAEMLRVASRSSERGGALDGGSGGRLYREMFFDEIGRAVVRSGGLGLARSLAAGSADEAGGPGRAER